MKLDCGPRTSSLWQTQITSSIYWMNIEMCLSQMLIYFKPLRTFPSLADIRLVSLIFLPLSFDVFICFANRYFAIVKARLCYFYSLDPRFRVRFTPTLEQNFPVLW